MKLGSHNTMTYLKPQWWVRPFSFMAKCQNRSLKSQIQCGAELFDLRVVFEDGVPHFAHGVAIYRELDVYSTICMLELYSMIHFHETGEYFYVRIINEHNEHFKEFVRFCREIEHDFPHLRFFGGNNKKDWRTLYFFKNDLRVIDKYASCNHDRCKKDGHKEIEHKNNTGSILDDLCPRIYAWLFNKKWRNEYRGENVYLMQDFIGTY